MNNLQNFCNNHNSANFSSFDYYDDDNDSIPTILEIKALNNDVFESVAKIFRGFCAPGGGHHPHRASLPTAIGHKDETDQFATRSRHHRRGGKHSETKKHEETKSKERTSKKRAVAGAGSSSSSVTSASTAASEVRKDATARNNKKRSASAPVISEPASPAPMELVKMFLQGLFDTDEKKNSNTSSTTNNNNDNPIPSTPSGIQTEGDSSDDDENNSCDDNGSFYYDAMDPETILIEDPEGLLVLLEEDEYYEEEEEEDEDELEGVLVEPLEQPKYAKRALPVILEGLFTIFATLAILQSFDTNFNLEDSIHFSYNNNNNTHLLNTKLLTINEPNEQQGLNSYIQFTSKTQ